MLLAKKSTHTEYILFLFTRTYNALFRLKMLYLIVLHLNSLSVRCCKAIKNPTWVAIGCFLCFFVCVVLLLFYLTQWPNCLTISLKSVKDYTNTLGFPKYCQSMHHDSQVRSGITIYIQMPGLFSCNQRFHYSSVYASMLLHAGSSDWLLCFILLSLLLKGGPVA